MGKNRSLRVAEEIKREVADILANELKDPRLGFVTVTRVDLSSDLKYAKIFVSTLGDEQARKESLEGLRSSLGYLRREIGQRISLHHTPELSIHFDPSLEQGARIAEILNKVGGTRPGDD